MNSDQVTSRALTILGRVAGEHPANIFGELKLEDNLGMDSLKMSELVISLEDEFKIVIQDHEVDLNFTNVKTMLGFLESKVEHSPLPKAAPDKPILIVGSLGEVKTMTIGRADVWKSTEILAVRDGTIYQLHVTIPQLDKQEWRALENLDDVMKRFPNSVIKE